jgi:ABC-type multidrug transport system ATPase subunit
MLSLTGLTKSYGSRTVLDGIDLMIDAGESVALIGANGSGKTTTLRCIAGLARPDRGRIIVNGIDARRDPVPAGRHLSYLPQRPVFPATLTVRETLTVVARLRGLGPTAVERELDACAIDHVANRPVAELSGGERQRLGMAAAFLPPADLLLFDEPSASLDPAACRILFQRAHDLKREGRTLLFTTHMAADLRHLAMRVVLLQNGRIESEGSGEFELRRYERMLDGFLWRSDDETAVPESRLGLPGADDGFVREGRTAARTAAAGSR